MTPRKMPLSGPDDADGAYRFNEAGAVTPRKMTAAAMFGGFITELQ